MDDYAGLCSIEICVYPLKHPGYKSLIMTVDQVIESKLLHYFENIVEVETNLRGPLK